MQSALSSFNFLLRALSEKEEEISNLKKRIQSGSHPFGSDRSLDANGSPFVIATPTYEYPRVPNQQRQGRTPTYNVEYLLYGNSEKMQSDGVKCPPKVLTPPYEFEAITKTTTPHSNPTTQPKPEVLGLKSI